MKFPPEFKKAVSSLSHAEKDKLLFRLLKHDLDLCNRLQFELVEEGDTLQERRNEVEKEIRRVLKYNPYSPGYLMMYMRGLSGEITRHIRHTKDKEGEVKFNLLMLRLSIENHLEFIMDNFYRAEKLQDYMVTRTKQVLDKLKKFHEDLYVEYEDDVNFILENLHSKVAPNQAKRAGLPKQWP